MFIRFKTDSSIELRGFRLTWTLTVGESLQQQQLLSLTTTTTITTTTTSITTSTTTEYKFLRKRSILCSHIDLKSYTAYETNNLLYNF